MHIVIISRSFPNRINRSSGNFVLNQVEALAKHDIKIGVVGVYNVSLKEAKKPSYIKNYGYNKEIKDNVVSYSHLYPVIPKLHYLNHRIKFRIWKKLLKKYIKENGKPDLIHLHTFEPGAIAIWAKEKYGIPFMVTEHTSLFLRGKGLGWHLKLAKKVYIASSYSIAVSKSSVDYFEERFSSRFHYLPNFVDTSHFTLKELQDSDTIQFITVSYLEPNKNHKLLINAFNMVFGKSKKVQLLIVGSGPEKNNIRNQIDSLDAENIKLYGYASQEDIVKLYQDSDFFVLSSNFETFGLVLIEAMSCGLPVASTSCGGPESIIIDDKLGFLCEKENVNALSEVLIRLTQTEFDSSYIRDYAVQSFSYESLSQKLIDIYKTIIK